MSVCLGCDCELRKSEQSMCRACSGRVACTICGSGELKNEQGLLYCKEFTCVSGVHWACLTPAQQHMLREKGLCPGCGVLERWRQEIKG